MKRSYISSVVVLISGMTLAACGGASVSASTASGKSNGGNAKKVSPNRIIPIPAGTNSGSSPLPNGTMWVVAGNSASKGLFQIDLSSGKVVASVSVSNTASSVAQSPTGEIALGLASPSGGGALEFHSGTTGAVVGTVALPGKVISLAAGSDGTKFFALTKVGAASSVEIVQDTTSKIIGTIPVPKGSIAVAVTPDEKHIYTVDPSGTATETAIANGQIDGQFSIGHSARAISISPDGSLMYVLKGQGNIRNIAVVNLAKESVTGALPAAANSVAAVGSPNGSFLYDIVGDPSLGNIQVIKLS